MDPSTSLWIVAPAAGAVIGWATNALAVRMLFRPHQPRRVLGFTFQGLVARRQGDLARSIGAVVGGHLLEARDLARALEGADLAGLVDEALAAGLEPKLAELRRLPLVGGFLTDERVADLRASLARGLVEGGQLERLLERGLDQGLDVSAMVEEKVRAFPVAKLETLVLEVARRELRAIEAWGAVLGGAVGVVQAGLLNLLG
jgi:uncharacterized membrane protein YheB (UPF0754 family)